MNTLKIAFFGTPDFSALFLEKLLVDNELSAEVVIVVTQPDKPVGRKQILTPTPVKEVARKYDIDLYDDKISSSLASLLTDVDLVILYAYGEIISATLLAVPKHGFWNIHPSLLPLYRGASPITYPLILGDTQTGVTLMQMDKELDHGPIIAQKTYDIKPSDKRSDLESNLTEMGYEMFKTTFLQHALTKFKQLKPVLQNHENATFTRKLSKQDGFIPFSVIKIALNNQFISADELPEIIKDYLKINNMKYEIPNTKYLICNLFRGLHPWPGIWTTVIIDDQEKRLKITDMALESDKLIINKVQLEGKQEASLELFQKAYKLI